MIANVSSELDMRANLQQNVVLRRSVRILVELYNCHMHSILWVCLLIMGSIQIIPTVIMLKTMPPTCIAVPLPLQVFLGICILESIFVVLVL